MNKTVRTRIKKIVAKAKPHRDAFAVQEIVELLDAQIRAFSDDAEQVHDFIVEFTDAASEELSSSPVYSDALMREFYRGVLHIAEDLPLKRETLLEDLLFQSLKRPPEAERSKRTRQKDAKSRILTAAVEEFSEKGFHSTTIDSIAERAGIAKGTVYRHFKTKEALFQEVKEKTISEFVTLAKQEIGQEQDVLELIESVIRNYLGFFEQNSAFFKVLVQEQRDFGRELSEKFIDELIRGLPALKRRCWKASREGRLKQMNYFTVFYGIIGFLNGVIQKWLHEGGEGSVMDEFDTIRQVLFYGFAVPPEEADTTNPFKVVS